MSGAVAILRPVVGPVGEALFERAMTDLNSLIDQLDAFDAKRHSVGSVLLFEDERRRLRQTRDFFEHVRRNGFSPTPI